MLNVVAVMGRLAADPVMRQTNSGKAVASFRVACDRGRKNADGSKQTDWLDCTAWDKTAEFVCRYFQKGSMIAVTGSIQTRTYQDKNGQNRTAVEINARDVNFAGDKNPNFAANTENGFAAPTVAPPSVAAPAPSADDYTIISEEGDLPF